MELIEYLETTNLINKYAYVTNPTPNDKQELKEKGYTYFSSYKVNNHEAEDYGKWKEIWIK